MLRPAPRPSWSSGPAVAPRARGERNSAPLKVSSPISKRQPSARAAWVPAGQSFAASLGSWPSSVLGVSAVACLQTAISRVFRRRRGRRRAHSSMASQGTARFSVATFNIRGVMDRWAQRQPLLKQCLRQMDADVVCMQEVLTGEYGQDRSLLGPAYHVFSCKAALFNLLQESGTMGVYARFVSRLLELPLASAAMATVPAAAEAARERWRLGSNFLGTLRDLSMAPFFGNSVACRLAEAHEIKHGTLVLGDWRAAQRIEFAIAKTTGGGGPDDDGPGSAALSGEGSPAANGHEGSPGQDGGSGEDGGGAVAPIRIWVVNMHLDHDHTDNRQRQALAVCDWMEGVRHNGCAAVVLCGDMNGPPGERFHAELRRQGYRSAHRLVHGREPEVRRACRAHCREPEGTWPTGIQAPFMDHGAFECLDYIYVWAADGYTVRVLDAQVWGDQPAPHDPTLYPSDHAAIKATIEISRAPKVGGAADFAHSLLAAPDNTAASNL